MTSLHELNMGLYRTMYLIRHAEESILEHYPGDGMKTPMHMSMGEEAIVAGVCQALDPTDQVLGTYRSHALYLAKTGETDRFFSEMYGKAGGTADGKAGSMHLSAPDAGLLGCSAIVSSSIPVAMGAAFANKYRKNGRKVATFFGDGATDAGVFWESLNFAALKALPILFICEDNDLAVHTRKHQRQGFKDICAVAAQYEVNVLDEHSTDVSVIHGRVCEALAMMAENGKPCFLRFHYYRYLEHCGVQEDFAAGYRCREEILPWLEKDPVLTQRAKLLEIGIAPETVREVECAVEGMVAASIKRAEDLPFAPAEVAGQGVFACE